MAVACEGCFRPKIKRARLLPAILSTSYEADRALLAGQPAPIKPIYPQRLAMPGSNIRRRQIVRPSRRGESRCSCLMMRRDVGAAFLVAQRRHLLLLKPCAIDEMLWQRARLQKCRSHFKNRPAQNRRADVEPMASQLVSLGACRGEAGRSRRAVKRAASRIRRVASKTSPIQNPWRKRRGFIVVEARGAETPPWH